MTGDESLDRFQRSLLRQLDSAYVGFAENLLRSKRNRPKKDAPQTGKGAPESLPGRLRNRFSGSIGMAVRNGSESVFGISPEYADMVSYSLFTGCKGRSLRDLGSVDLFLRSQKSVKTMF